jgi:hypothetical protein
MAILALWGVLVADGPRVRFLILDACRAARETAEGRILADGVGTPCFAEGCFGVVAV